MASVRASGSAEDITYNLDLWALYRDDALCFVLNVHIHRPAVRRFGHLVTVNVGTLHIEYGPCLATFDLGNGIVSYYAVSEEAVTLTERVPLADV